TTNAFSCATCDADGSGQSNLTKFHASINPLDPSPAPGLPSVATLGATLTATNTAIVLAALVIPADGLTRVWFDCGDCTNCIIPPFTNSITFATNELNQLVYTVSNPQTTYTATNPLTTRLPPIGITNIGLPVSQTSFNYRVVASNSHGIRYGGLVRFFPPVFN